MLVVQAIFRSINTSLEEVLIGLLMSVKLDAGREVASTTPAQPNLPFFSLSFITQTFDYICTVLPGGCRTVISLLSTRQVCVGIPTCVVSA